MQKDMCNLDTLITFIQRILINFDDITDILHQNTDK